MWMLHSMRHFSYPLGQFTDHFGVQPIFCITFISKEYVHFMPIHSSHLWDTSYIPRAQYNQDGGKEGTEISRET